MYEFGDPIYVQYHRVKYFFIQFTGRRNVVMRPDTWYRLDHNCLVYKCISLEDPILGLISSCEVFF